MHRKRLMKLCMTGAIVAAVGTSNVSAALAADNKPAENVQEASEQAQETVTMKLSFKNGDKVIAGGDYTVPSGVNNYSVLEQYVPEGYKMTTSGDFYAEDGGSLVVNIEKIQTDVSVNISFKDGDEVIAGGDYTVPSGVNNYSVLEQYVPEGYKMTTSGDFYAEKGVHLDVNIEKIQKDVSMNIVFKDGDKVIAGGDYTVPEGINNYSVLEQYVPKGYKMTVSGDFTAEDGGHLDINVEKIQKYVIMNVVFKDGDKAVGGGDYFVLEGVNNYSVLEKYVPKGYEMTVSGDFTAKADGKLEVSVKKIQKDVIMNISFKDGDEVVGGGDYFVPEGINNYSVLEQYVPEGYKMTVSGDFTAEKGGHLDINVEKIQKDVIMNIVFKDGDKAVGGGDYFVPEGVNNYSVLEQYVPEGYKMTVSGDFYAEKDGKLEVNVEKIQKDVIMNISFKENGKFVAGGDYFVPEGINNYSVLEQYVPEGYKMTVSGDFYAEEGGQLEVNVEKIQKNVIMNISFKDGDEVVAGGDYFVPAGINNYSALEQYVPEGYEMTVSGDFFAVEGAHLDVNVKKVQTEIIMNIAFKDGDKVVAAGDYFIPKKGVNNYSVLEQYVPEGYEMTVSGDFFAVEGGHLDVNIQKIQKDVIMNIAFNENGQYIAGGDYFVPAGINNYSILEQYVPEGYEMTVSGDFFAEEGGHLDVNIQKIKETATLKVTFETVDGQYVGETDFMSKEGVRGENGVFKLGEDFELPEGYQLAADTDQVTDIEIPYGSIGGHTMLVEKIAEPENPSEPENPGDTGETTDPSVPGGTDTEDPSDTTPVVDDDKLVPDDNKTTDTQEKADQKEAGQKEESNVPKTADTASASASAAAVTAGLAAGLAAVVAAARKKIVK